MLHDKRMPYSFWGKSANTEVYILNRCPTEAYENKTLLKHSVAESLKSCISLFGSICYCLVPGQLRQKRDEAVVKWVFLRYGKSE